MSSQDPDPAQNQPPEPADDDAETQAFPAPDGAAPEALPVSNMHWYIVHTYSGFRE